MKVTLTVHDGLYCLVLPHHESPTHHLGEWYQVKHPENWRLKWAAAGPRIAETEKGDIYGIWTWNDIRP